MSTTNAPDIETSGTDGRTDPDTPHHDLLVAILRERGECSGREVQSAYRNRGRETLRGTTTTPVSRRRVRQILGELRDDGVVRARGEGHNRTYEFVGECPHGREFCPISNPAARDDALECFDCFVAL